VTTLEDLIRDGLDVEQIPPGTAVIMHARKPLNANELHRLGQQAREVGAHLGIRIAVVSHDFDVLLVPEAFPLTVNGTPADEEIRR
jgi:hypothetical protein